MPRLGLGLGAQISASSAYDADAASYFARAGVTDATAKAQISAFAKGLKNLGLWNSTVCWLLKSSQNAGTGTTAYSFGGLGTFNGTLVNGPTWGANGITFDGSDDVINLPNGTLGTGNTATSIIAFLQPTGASLGVVIGSGAVAGASSNYYHLKARGSGGSDLATMAFTDVAIDTSDTTFKSLFMGNTTLGFKGKNGGTVTSFSLAFSLNKVGDNTSIGYFAPSPQPFAGTISAIVKINATPSTQLNSDIHSLYISTLAKIPNLDSDADAYISRANILDPTAQTQVNDFVIGVKNLGLWSNMICWPLRSAQNAGTGTTAYSLGGLENPNASLVNSPTWGADGITTNGTNSYVISTLTNVPAFSYSVFNVCKYVGAVNGILGAVANSSQAFSAAGMHNFFTFAGTQNNFYNSTPAQAALTLTNSIGTSGMSANLACYTSTGGLAYNGSQTLTNTFTKGGSAPNRVIVGARLGSGTAEVFAQSQHAVIIMFSSDISANSSAFYSLYKTTLGTGLGLP